MCIIFLQDKYHYLLHLIMFFSINLELCIFTPLTVNHIVTLIISNNIDIFEQRNDLLTGLGAIHS